MSGFVTFVTLLGTLAAYFGASQGANILCIFTSSSPSHNIVHMSYARGLVERGHNVTVITSLPLKGKDKELPYNHILIPPTEARINQMEEMKSAMSKPMSAIDSLIMATKGVMNFGPIQYDVVMDKRFQDFMHNPNNKFDLLIMGYFFSDYLLGLGLHFNCPVVISWMSLPNIFIDRFVGNPLEISYVPASPMTGAPDPLTFKGRLTNFFLSLSSKLFISIIDYQMAEFYKGLFPDPSFPSIKEAGKKVSLVLCNSHFSEGIIRPNVPAIIEAGGIQIKEKADPLPKDLQEIFDNSKEHGVIYLSFGSNIGGSNMSPDTYNAMFKVLSGLKQTILWKWDSDKTPGDSPNIHYRKWLPQDDILSQPRLKLFITHAGKGSVTESQYHGVPMVAVPIVADQPRNADQIEKDGFGVRLPLNALTAETLSVAVQEVLDNPKYSENIKRFSKLYRDRPLNAKKTAMYWLEYVIRHKGAYHMQSPLVHLNTLQYISADVIAFLLLVIYVVYKTVKCSVKFAYRKIFKKAASGKVKKQ